MAISPLSMGLSQWFSTVLSVAQVVIIGDIAISVFNGFSGTGDTAPGGNPGEGMKNFGEKWANFWGGAGDMFTNMGGVSREKNRIKGLRKQEKILIENVVNNKKKTIDRLKAAKDALTQLANILAQEAGKPGRNPDAVISQANNLFTQVINLLNEIHSILQTDNANMTRLVRDAQLESKLEDFIAKLEELQKVKIVELENKFPAVGGTIDPDVKRLKDAVAAAATKCRTISDRIRMNFKSGSSLTTLESLQLQIQRDMDELTKIVNTLGLLKTELDSKNAGIDFNKIAGDVVGLNERITRVEGDLKRQSDTLANYRDITGRDDMVLKEFEDLLAEADTLEKEIDKKIKSKKSKGGGGGGGPKGTATKFTMTVPATLSGFATDEDIKVEILKTKIKLTPASLSPQVTKEIDDLNLKTYAAVAAEIAAFNISSGGVTLTPPVFATLWALMNAYSSIKKEIVKRCHP